MNPVIDVKISPEDFTEAIAERCFKPITQDEANMLLRDPELHAESLRTGIDLGMLVENMMLTPAERWRKGYEQARNLSAWDASARKAGLKK
jgi:hypothetical protein